MVKPKSKNGEIAKIYFSKEIKKLIIFPQARLYFDLYSSPYHWNFRWNFIHDLWCGWRNNCGSNLILNVPKNLPTAGDFHLYGHDFYQFTNKHQKFFKTRKKGKSSFFLHFITGYDIWRDLRNKYRQFSLSNRH